MQNVAAAKQSDPPETHAGSCHEQENKSLQAHWGFICSGIFFSQGKHPVELSRLKTVALPRSYKLPDGSITTLDQNFLRPPTSLTPLGKL